MKKKEYINVNNGASLVTQMVKNPPSQPLGGEDPLEKGVATHSRILAWEIPWTEEPGGNPMDGGAWRAAVCGVSKSQTRFSN